MFLLYFDRGIRTAKGDNIMSQAVAAYKMYKRFFFLKKYDGK